MLLENQENFQENLKRANDSIKNIQFLIEKRGPDLPDGGDCLTSLIIHLLVILLRVISNLGK